MGLPRIFRKKKKKIMIFFSFKTAIWNLFRFYNLIKIFVLVTTSGCLTLTAVIKSFSFNSFPCIKRSPFVIENFHYILLQWKGDVGLIKAVRFCLYACFFFCVFSVNVPTLSVNWIRDVGSVLCITVFFIYIYIILYRFLSMLPPKSEVR